MMREHEASRGIRRRQFLWSTLAAGGAGLTLSDVLRLRAQAATGGDTPPDTAVIQIWLGGGPSQFETFDPKPDAPAEIRTVGGLAKTALPGVYFGEKLEKLARHADKFTVVRSFATNNGGHNIRPLVGPESRDTYVGSVYSSVVGATSPATSVPTNSVVFPQAVCNDVAKGQGRGDFAAAGQAGVAFAPFIPGEGGELQKNLRLNLPA